MPRSSLLLPFIMQILKYFSYEHFYVIYCKFWELDQDHDFLIDRSDLAHYSQGAMSLQIIDRVFEQASEVSLACVKRTHALLTSSMIVKGVGRRQEDSRAQGACGALLICPAGATPLLKSAARKDVI